MRDFYCCYERGMFATEPAGARDRLFFHDAIAFHEAGHAVCGFALGFGCSRIVMSEACGDGRQQASCAYFSARRAQRRVYADLHAGRYSTLLARHAAVCAAGPAAERRFYIERALPVRTLNGAFDDHREIETICQQIACIDGRRRLAFRRMIWRVAQTMVMQPIVWRATEALAAHLAELMPPQRDSEREAGSFAIMKGAAARAIMRRAGIEPIDLSPSVKK